MTRLRVAAHAVTALLVAVLALSLWWVVSVFGVVTLIRILVAASVGLSLWFVISLGNPRRSENPTIAWLLAAWAWVTIAFETLLLLALFRIHLPAWIAVLVLSAQDGIFAWRLVLMHRSRRQDKATAE